MNLTWDAVAELPRDTPLVLPLGSGYDLDLLSSQLSNPAPNWTPATFPVRLARQRTRNP